MEAGGSAFNQIPEKFRTSGSILYRKWYNTGYVSDEYEKYADDGSFQYQIIIDETDIQKSPAKYSITGRIRMQPVTVRSILPKSFDIPFKLSSNNIRTDD